MNVEKENVHKTFEKKNKAVPQLRTHENNKKRFTNIFGPKLPKRLHRLFRRWIINIFYRIGAKVIQKSESFTIPKKDRFIVKIPAHTWQNYGSSCFGNGKKTKSLANVPRLKVVELLSPVHGLFSNITPIFRGSWHSQWNRKHSRFRPQFLENHTIFFEKVEKEFAIAQIEIGLLPPIQKEKLRIFNCLLIDLKRSPLSSDRNIFEYWAAFSYRRGPATRWNKTTYFVIYFLLKFHIVIFKFLRFSCS